VNENIAWDNHLVRAHKLQDILNSII